MVPPWYDWVLAAASVFGMLYFVITAEQSLDSGWEYAAPETARWFSLLIFFLILEGTRRAGGTALFIIVALFSVYPTFGRELVRYSNARLRHTGYRVYSVWCRAAKNRWRQVF
jgi:TRAP-type uncharacterized transport system fused permease subunit